MYVITKLVKNKTIKSIKKFSPSWSSGKIYHFDPTEVGRYFLTKPEVGGGDKGLTTIG